MKIVHVGNYSPLEEAGGVETVTDAVCRGLAGGGHTVSLLCFSRKGDSVTEVCEGFKVIALKSPLSFFEMPVPLSPHITSLFTGIKEADVVHIHSLTVLGAFISTLACLLYRKPYVFTLHSHLGVGEYGRGRGLLYKIVTWFYSVFVLRVSLKYSRYVVTPSPGFLSLSDYTRGYESKAVSIPHGVDLSLFNPGAGGGKIKGMLDLKGKVVLFVSSLDKSRRGRGLELLFDAFRLLVEDAPEAKLLIVGEGDLRSFYAEYARKLGVDGKTVFAGAVSRERMPEYYSACDVFVFPSLFNEPFGLSLLEAMACGKPVVGSKVGGLPYVVGDAGVLVPPNDVNALYGVLKKFLLDGDYAREVGARCLDRAKSKFAWNVVLTEYGNLYAKVLSEG